MKRLEEAMNRLSDIDAGWWPFLHLRPKRTEPMDNRFLARASIHYGTLFGLLVYGWYLHVGFLPLSPFWPVVCVLVAVAFFFVAYKYTFAVFWNRRAARAGQQGAGNDASCDAKHGIMGE